MPTIVLTDIGLFVLTMYLNNCPSRSHDCVGADVIGRFSFENSGNNFLMLGPAPETLQRLGALETVKVVEQKEIWRLFTCMWLHAGLIHIAVNMISLSFVGYRLEEDFGFLRIGLLFIMSGLGGSILSALFNRNNVSVGASGALFGLLGAMLSELLTNWSNYVDKCCALTTLILVVAINMVIGILIPRVDNFAHIGGFMTGFLIGFVLLIRPQYAYLRQKYAPPGYYGTKSKSKYKCCQCFLVVVSLVILVIGFLLGFYYLLRGVDLNSHCSWCHHLKCVPTPWSKCDRNNQGPQVVKCESTIYRDQMKLMCQNSGKSQFYPLIGNYDHDYLSRLCGKQCL